MRSWLLAVPFALLLATPAAALSCQETGFRVGGSLNITGSLHIGAPYTEDDIARFDLMALRQHGIDATRAERWAGCIRAWVRQPGGGQRQEFYDPNTLQRLDPRTGAPLDLRLY